MFTIRPAGPRDAEALWQVQIATARSTFRGMMPDEAFERFVADTQRTNRWRGWLRWGPWFTLAAEVDGQIVGYAQAGPARPSPRGWAGEIYLLYVLQEYQGRGIGRALLLAAAAQLARVGMRSMTVWSLVTNGPARGFYERMGGEYVEERTMRDAIATWPLVVYGWRDLPAFLETARRRWPEAYRQAVAVTPARTGLSLPERVAAGTIGLALAGAGVLIGVRGVGPGLVWDLAPLLGAGGLFLLFEALRRR